MKHTIYDLSGLEGFEDVLKSLEPKTPFVVKSAEALAKQNVEALVGQRVILSDERFGNKSDEEIQRYLEQLSQTGLFLLYLGVSREDPAFEQHLRGLNVQPYLVDVLTEEGVQQWLSEQLAAWPESPEGDLESVTTLEETVTETAEPVHAASEGDSLCIVVSGAPGAGTTFVGLNLAVSMSESGNVNYVEASMRPCLTTWLGAEDKESESTLSNPVRPAFQHGRVQVYTRNPFGEESVPLRSLAEELASWRDPTVLDLSLQDYLASLKHAFATRTVRVLVTTSDVHRCRYLEGIEADVVVVNQMTTQLPIDEQEYQAFWPDAALVFIPYEAQQSVAIVQGQAVIHDSLAVAETIERLQTHVKGGERVEARAI
ncbi:hypothetical protein LLE49_22240 [Alicyclobacillus tolerans]|uniref:hypothetical protein n=1 Tax=Alicyclobacillus tolerans TaxID=90970 RepID=UPI001F40F1C8|nr:hypothetical protein [Alicyclobacillus tolerans]MCF8567442.1 hypothetical protein [Alicyclobacillus tolerans]